MTECSVVVLVNEAEDVLEVGIEDLDLFCGLLVLLWGVFGD
jgi:hypothetical protein